MTFHIEGVEDLHQWGSTLTPTNKPTTQSPTKKPTTVTTTKKHCN